MRDDAAGCRLNDSDVVVFLHGDGDLAGIVESDELRLRIVTGDFGESGHHHGLHGGAVGHAVGQGEDLQVACRQLRDFAVVQILVALVLDGDREEIPILADGNRVRLAAEVAGAFDRLRSDVDDGEVAGWLGVALRGVDASQHLAADDGDRCWLPVDPDDAARLGRPAISDVDEADRAERAVGISEHGAVFAGGDDLGRGLGIAVDIGRQIVGHCEAGDAVEHHVGVSRQRDGSGERRGHGEKCGWTGHGWRLLV